MYIPIQKFCINKLLPFCIQPVRYSVPVKYIYIAKRNEYNTVRNPILSNSYEMVNRTLVPSITTIYNKILPNRVNINKK